MPTIRGMEQAHAEDFVIGALFVALGAIYVIRARGLRDFSIRIMQREGYILFARAAGILILAVGVVVLIAWAKGIALL